MAYIEYKRKKKKHPLHSHTGTNSDYCRKVQAAAGEYGENRKTSAAREYVQNMHDLAFDTRMLMQAYKDQKGYAAGKDDVPVEELGRYGASVQWANHCRIPFTERPRYTETIFPVTDPRAIAMLSLFYQPDRAYRLKGITFSGGRRALPALSALGPLCTVEQAQELVQQFQGEDPLSFVVSGDERQSLSLPVPEPEIILNAGMSDDGLAHVVSIAHTAIQNAVVSATASRTKDKVMAFTPLKWLTSEHAAEEHLLWDACQWIHGMMKNGGYRPQPLRTLEIPKGDGGVRVLNIPTVIDRTVERATFMTLEPMLEKHFRPNSVGCRNDLDRFDVLASLHNHYPNARGKFILYADIRKAFDNVPHDHLLACLGEHIHNTRMLHYLKMVITRPGTNRGTVGIHQGGPLSPMLLNILLHERLDIPFLDCLRGDLVYVRYVDDLVVFGFASEDEGLALVELLQGILKPIGLSLHTEAPKTQIVNLAHHGLEVGWDLSPEASLTEGISVDRYLGLGLCGNDEGHLDFFLPRAWPDRIADMYHRADDKIEKGGYTGTEGAHTHIFHATTSWLHAFAPAWREEWQHEVAERIAKIAAKESRHGGGMDSGELAKEWEKGYRRWQKRCTETDRCFMTGWRRASST